MVDVQKVASAAVFLFEVYAKAAEHADQRRAKRLGVPLEPSDGLSFPDLVREAGAAIPTIAEAVAQMAGVDTTPSAPSPAPSASPSPSLFLEFSQIVDRRFVVLEAAVEALSSELAALRSRLESGGAV